MKEGRSKERRREGRKEGRSKEARREGRSRGGGGETVCRVKCAACSHLLLKTCLLSLPTLVG